MAKPRLAQNCLQAKLYLGQGSAADKLSKNTLATVDCPIFGQKAAKMLPQITLTKQSSLFIS